MSELFNGLLQNENFMSWLFDALPPEVLLIIVALYVMGMVLKRIPKCPDWAIPIAVMVIGVLLTTSVLGYTATNVVFGIIAGGLATSGNQIFKQLKYKRLP